MPETRSNGRENDRATVTLKVGYTRLNTFFADYTKNISKGGTFVRTTKPLDLGSDFIFELTVPSASGLAAPEVKIELKGVVKWIVTEAEATNDKPAGMGIQFVFEDEGQRQKVQTMVVDLMKASLGDHLAQKLLQRG